MTIEKDKESWSYAKAQPDKFRTLSVGEGMNKIEKAKYVEQQRKFTIWVESPSLFQKEPDVPPVLSQQSRIFKAGSCVEGTFGDQPHTAWESYVQTMGSPAYQTIVSGDLYPKRRELNQTQMPRTEELLQWEQQTSPQSLAKRNKHLRSFRETIY